MGSKIRYISALGVAMLTLSGYAYSQDDAELEKKAEQETKASEPEKISIIGSRIKRIDTKGPQPVLTLDKEDLEKTGATTLNEALNTLTVASFGSGNYGSGYGVGENVQSISIRGLGSSNTLVLVNGRRLARDPYLEIIDMSSIPLAAVERVDILKGTASAIYGSDALGGVVNIVTKKDFQGVGYGLSRTQARFEGGNEDQLFVMSGTSSANSRNLTVLQYNHTDPILYDDRPWYDDNWRSSYGSVPSYQALNGEGSPVWQAARECENGTIESAGNTLCEWNHLDYLERVGETSKLSILNDYAYDISSNTTATLRLFAARGQAKSDGTPTVYDYQAPAANLPQGLSLAANANDDGLVAVRGRLADGGRSYTTTDTLTLSAQASVTHDMNDGSSVEFSISDSRVNRDTFWANRYDEPALIKAIESGEYNIFAESPTDRGNLDLYKLDSPNSNTSFTRSAESVFSGTSDIVDYAIGATYIVEGYDNDVARQTEAERVKDLGGGGGAGDRVSRALFGEINIPLESVEIKGAARYDDYSDFGGTFNPQLGMTWKPFDSFLFAASYGTGFKAPSLRDVNDDTARYYTSIQDYLQCNQATAANNEDDIESYCKQRQSVEILSGGNKELDPQTSTAFSVNLGYEPKAGYGMGLEYFNSVIDDVITRPDGDEMARYEAANRPLPNGVVLERDPTTGDLVRVILPVTNLASVKTSGIDTTLYLGEKTTFGNLGYRSTYSYYLSYQNKRSPDSDYIEEISTNGLPRWRWNNQFNYGIDRHSVTMTNIAISGYEKNNPDFGDVGMHNQWDMNYRYNHAWNGTVEVGGRNIFNQVYPYDDSAGLSQGIGGSLYSITGPTVYARYTQTL